MGKKQHIHPLTVQLSDPRSANYGQGAKKESPQPPEMSHYHHSRPKSHLLEPEFHHDNHDRHPHHPPHPQDYRSPHYQPGPPGPYHQPPGYMQPQYGYPPPPMMMQPVNQVSQNQGTNIIVNASATATGATGPKKKRLWKAPFCGCLNDVTCFAGLFCPCCFGAYLANRMGEFTMLPFCIPQFVTALRVKIRSEQRIVGSISTDCCASNCLPGMVLCQIKRELDAIDKENKTPPVSL